MVAVQRRFCPLLSPVGSSRGVLYSGPYFDLFIVAVIVPSLVLTGAVCLLIYLGVRAVRRGQKASAAIMLIAALAPFLLFAARVVQASIQDRQHANCLAALPKTGPAADYPNVLITNFYLLNQGRVRVMMAGGFDEVDDVPFFGGRPPYPVPNPIAEAFTYTIAPTGSCREKLKAWEARQYSDDEFRKLDLDPCLKVINRDSAPKRSAAVIFLRGRPVPLRCGGSANRELRIKDSRGEVLVDYLEESTAERPIFPFYVSLGGFMSVFNAPYLSRALSAPHLDSSMARTPLE